VRGPVAGGDFFEQVVGVSAAEHGPGESTHRRDEIVSSSVPRERQQAGIETHPERAETGHLVMAEPVRQPVQLCGADQNGQVEESCADSDLLVGQVQLMDEVEREEGMGFKSSFSAK